MSAGNGIVHSEHNREDVATTLFQIWILPDTTGGEPFWDQREFPRGDRSGQWVILASGTPEADDALPIRADAKVLALLPPVVVVVLMQRWFVAGLTEAEK